MADDMKSKTMALARSVLPSLHGWCSPEKSDRLVESVLGIDMLVESPLLVEIGVFGGSSLVPQAMALRARGAGKIVGIDPWTHEDALDEMQEDVHRDWWTKVPIEQIRESCEAAIGRLGLGDHVELVQATSEAAVSDVEDDSVDLLHIDGNHGEQHALTDVTLWMPKVKSGGIVMIDDIYWKENGKITTRAAVMLARKSCEVADVNRKTVGDCIVLRKT